MRLLVLITAVLFAFSSFAYNREVEVSINIKQVHKTAELNTFAGTVANLTKVYYPELIHILKGKEKIGQRLFNLAFGKTEKTKPIFFQKGELKVNIAYFESIRPKIDGKPEQFGALWTEQYPQDVTKVLSTLAREIIRYKEVDVTIEAVNSYISQRYTFSLDVPKIDPNDLKNPFTIASFWRFVEKKDNRELIKEVVKQPKKFLPQNNRKLYRRFKRYILNEQDKKVWYPVNITYSEAPDMEYFALQNKLYTEAYYDTLINQLDSEDFKPYENVQIRIREGHGVAATGGNRISYAAPFYRNNPSDYGSVIHELTHVVQQSPYYDPVWVIEATADYMRYYHGYRGNIVEEVGGHFTRGYRYGADFLRYIEKTYQIKDFVKKLNVEVRNSTFHVPSSGWSHEERIVARAKQLKLIDKYLIPLTSKNGKKGKSVAALWEEYQLWLESDNRKPLWENQDMPRGTSLPEAITTKGTKEGI